MAISRCNQCGTISEHERNLVETRQPCVQCGTSTIVYDTVYFVKKLSDIYFAQRKELNAIRPNETITSKVESKKALETFDIHNSDILSSLVQHKPIIDWFKTKSITATANVDAVDTTGFFDEAAIAIGTDFDLLGEVCERIRYAQLKEYNSNIIYLDKKSKADAKSLEDFIQQLYKHSLIARLISNKKEKSIRIVLQNAPSVRRFFAGDWLEWYALLIALRICQERKVEFSCARSMTLTFAPTEKREIDVFFLINNTQPILIECKTGDYRQELDKYVALRKALGINQSHFILCVADLDGDQLKGLSAMYRMTFVNTQTLGPHLLTLI